MELERASIYDTERLHRLLHDAHKINNELGIHFTTGNVSKERVRQHIESVPTYVYKDDKNELICTASVELPWTSAGMFYLPNIGWLATNPKYKNKGFGRKIIKDVVEQYVKNILKAPAVTLDTANNHPWLKGFYISLGFSPLTKVRLVSDHESIYMIKIIDESLLKKNSEDIINEFLKKDIK